LFFLFLVGFEVGLMASAVAYVMPAMVAFGSGAYNVAVAPRSQTKRATSSSSSAVTVASTIALPFRASRRCLEQKSGFFSGLALVSLFPGSSSFRAEVTRPLMTVIAKVSETETKTEISAAEATEEASEEFEAALKNTLKSVQEAWDKADDKLAISGLGFAALLVLWASTGLINAIDKLPLIPAVFEFVGILFSGWFVYRYLLFKPDREELFKLIDDAKSKITGQ
jgi:hypothetical protein